MYKPSVIRSKWKYSNQNDNKKLGLDLPQGSTFQNRITRRSSVPPSLLNNFPIECNVFVAGTGEQVVQTSSNGEKDVDDHEQVLDLNQTLAVTVALQPENTVCYDDLGCITRFSFADPLLWPINLLPEDREKIDTHFTLHTRENPNPQVKGPLS